MAKFAISMARIPSADLFPTEEPLPLGEFFGRDDSVAELVEALEARTHCILAEPRRTGKTTVARAVLAGLEARGFYTVSVDLWEFADQGELASALVARTIANRPRLKRLPHILRESGKKAAEAIQIVTSAKLSEEFGQEIEVAWKPSLADRDPRLYLRFALELPQQIAARDERRMIVFFDEFQNVLDLEQTGGTKDKTALQKLMRTAFVASDRCSYLFAGSIEHLIRQIFSAEEPLGHFGGFYDLSPIESGDWKTGLEERFARDDCTLSGGALSLLVELGELHPRATMLIAQQTHVAAVAGDVGAIDTDLVRLGHAAARRHERARHQSMVDRIRALGGKKTGAMALKSVKRVARGEEAYAGTSDPKAIGRAMDALRDAGFIERLDGRGWRIRDPLLRDYLAEL
jgi:hypothetical protein